MIYQTIDLIFGFGMGILIGSFYFYSLWWTLRRLPRVEKKILWMTGSFLVRMCIALAGFYFVMAGRWERILACLLGFVLMRVVFSRCLRPDSKPGPGSTNKGMVSG